MQMNMLTTPLKIGIAAACLVAVALWIAIDQSSLRRDEVALTAAATPQAALPPLVVPANTVLPGRPEPAVICPTPAPAEDKKPADAPKVEEKPPVAAPAPARKILIETLAG